MTQEENVEIRDYKGQRFMATSALTPAPNFCQIYTQSCRHGNLPEPERCSTWPK
jgi:hypothetical protein